jgi:hypothetical protein
MMTSRSAAVIILAVLASGPQLAVTAPFHSDQQEKLPKKDAKETGGSLTGCVDERDGSYVLTDDRELKPVANLQAEGFPQEGFAKHLGHKVTVRGTSTPGDPIPTFKVRSITTVSESCAPKQQ